MCLPILFIYFLSTEKILLPSFLFSLAGASIWFLDTGMWIEMLYIAARYCK